MSQIVRTLVRNLSILLLAFVFTPALAQSGPRSIAVEATGAPQDQAQPRQNQAQPQQALATDAGSANVGNPRQDGQEQRLALVIGNSAYRNGNPLPNPANDARDIAKLLNTAGFEVIAATDLSHDEMIQVIQNFAAKIAQRGPNTVALVYYGGHGVQIAGDNFLVPVDAQIKSEADVESASIRLVDLMATLQAVPSRMRIVVLDACRNNPFPGFDDGGKGLAIVDAPNGSIVGYSTAPGSEALDGSGTHSPYAAAFLRLARQHDLPIEQFFKRVRLLVNDTTNGHQTPWESSSLTSDFYFFGETQAAEKAPPAKAEASLAQLRGKSSQEAYDIAITEDRVDYYQEFVRLYPSDHLCDKINALLATKLMSIAWYNAVLANSPTAYQEFYGKYSNSPYAKVALQLQATPKPQPIYQPSHIIVPPHLVPVVKLASLPAPKPIDVTKQAQVGQVKDLTRVPLSPQGKSLLDSKINTDARINSAANASGNKIETLPNGRILSGNETKNSDGDRTGAGGSRIVVLPNGGVVRVGPKQDGVVDLPQHRIATLEPQAPSSFTGSPATRDPRFQPGLRANAQTNGRNFAALQFRGQRTFRQEGGRSRRD